MTERTTAWSMGDFLTDGSLALLVDDLSALLECRVTLYDRSGAAIGPNPGSPPWKFEPGDPADAPILHALLDLHAEAPFEAPPPIIAAPIVVDDAVAGAMIVRFPAEVPPPERWASIRRAIDRVAATASEFCSENVDKRRRNAELAMLFRLSSLLVASRSLEESLNIALRSAMDLIGAEAGTIHLIDGDPPLRRLCAHAGLPAAVSAAIAAVPIDASTSDPVVDAIAPYTPLTIRAKLPLMFKDQHYGTIRLFSADTDRLSRREELLLGTIAEQTAAAIAGVRLEESERERRQMHRHLALAADIQRRMLPSGMPDVKGIGAAARYVSSLELGGDFYDFIPLSGHLGIVVGDVVGKGVPAALLMSAVRATLRAHAPDLYDIDQVISRVNVALTRDTRDNEFATVFFGVIDPATLRLTYCNAGHDPPLVVRPTPGGSHSGFEVLRLGVGGMAVGIDEGQTYQRDIFHLKRGDVLMAYTDGVTDARNFGDEKFGLTRLTDCITALLADKPDATADHIVDHILWDVRRFTGLRPAVDDITMVCLRMV